MTDKMREGYEAWVLSEYPNQNMGKFSDGEYHSTTIQYCWLAWQASRNTLEIALPPEPTVPDEPDEAIDDSFMDGYYAAQGMRNACAQNITAAGLKVKP
jgi:hypothetical protein